MDATDFLPPGTPVDLDNCAREPIHLPGAVQAHGALLVARAADREVVQLSSNVSALLGLSADQVLGTTLDALMGAEAADRLVAAALRDDGPAVRPDEVVIGGVHVETHAFTPAPGLIGLDLEPFEPATPEPLAVINRVSTWAARLQQQDSVDGAMEVAASALRELTGYDRAWAYRFADDDHGIVIAEDRREDLESFLGLHFPASDIPPQARELYLRNGARVIGDSWSEDAALEPLRNPETGEWLDLSASGLRAVSSMHIRYLRNMGVRSSMSVPVIVGGRLWGLLSAHAYETPRPLSIRGRAECEMLGALTSMQLSTTTELSRARDGLLLYEWTTKLGEQLSTHESFTAGLTADPQALLGVCRASGAIVAIGGERTAVGAVPAEADIDLLLAVLARSTDEFIVSDGFTRDEPVLEHLAGVASGIVAFPLSRSRGNWVVWLRGETVQEVTWANRDQGLVRREPSGALDLGHRESFERWAEEVRGRSTPWQDAEIDAVQNLRASLGTLLIARTERLARLNDELTRSNEELDAFAYAAAHDLREPVRGIEQFSDFLEEDFGAVLGEEGLGHVATIRRLAGRMSGLLGSLLEYAEVGESTWTRSTVHLPTVVDEVKEILAATIGDAVIEVEDRTVQADADGLRQLLLNLIWNAIKYSEGTPRIEVGGRLLSQAESGEARVRRSLLGDADPVALYVRDQGIGIAAEHHEAVFELFRRLHGREAFGGGHGAGLALARRIVERHGGVIWIESTPGEGTTVNFTLEPV